MKITFKFSILNICKIKFTEIFTPESSIYQNLYRKNCLIAVILSKKNILFGTKLLHASIQCVYIVKLKYQIVLSKAVVGVDRSMKILSMHIQKPD